MQVHKCNYVYHWFIIIRNLLLLALSPKKVQEFFIPIVKLAKHLLKIHEEKPLKGMNKPPVVTVSD